MQEGETFSDGKLRLVMCKSVDTEEGMSIPTLWRKLPSLTVFLGSPAWFFPSWMACQTSSTVFPLQYKDCLRQRILRLVKTSTNFKTMSLEEHGRILLSNQAFHGNTCPAVVPRKTSVLWCISRETFRKEQSTQDAKIHAISWYTPLFKASRLLLIALIDMLFFKWALPVINTSIVHAGSICCTDWGLNLRELTSWTSMLIPNLGQELLLHHVCRFKTS